MCGLVISGPDYRDVLAEERRISTAAHTSNCTWRIDHEACSCGASPTPPSPEKDHVA